MPRIIVEQHVTGPGTYPNYPFRPAEVGDAITYPTIATIAELRSTTGTTGDCVEVQSYSTAGDGGGGLFVWSATAATDDGGTIINTGLGVSAAGWRRIYSGALSVEWFGATGDGTTNDTTAIQNTDSAAQALGSSILVPAGTFRISTNIAITSVIEILPGGKLSLNDGVTLTISNSLIAGYYQIFVLGSGAKVYGVYQSEAVKPHWWGITENDNTVDNANSIYESLSSFVNCIVKFGGMKAYLTKFAFHPTTSPWTTRRLTVDGEGAELISTVAAGSLAAPVFQCLTGKELCFKNFSVRMETAPDASSDSFQADEHLVSLGGYSSNWPEKLTISNVNTYDGYNAGIVPYHADEITVENCRVENILGTGIYSVNGRKIVRIDNCRVYRTGDDNIASVSDSDASDGTDFVTIDNVHCSYAYGGSHITITGARSWSVGPGVYGLESYSAGIRSEPGGQASPVNSETIHINNPTLIRSGRTTGPSGPNTQGNASGIALSGISSAYIKIRATCIDPKYAGVYVPETCEKLEAQLDLDGSFDLGGGELATVHGVYLGGDALVSTVINRAIIQNSFIKNTYCTSVYAAKVKNVEITNNRFSTWNIGGAGYASVGFISCDYAKLLRESNTFITTGTTIDTTGTTTFETDPIMNVKWFGAVGNGSTDDTNALQLAVDAAAGRTLLFPYGTYLGHIVVPSNTTLLGYGATLKLDATAGTADEEVSVITIGESSLVENVGIYGLTIDGYRSIGGPYVSLPDALRFGINIGWANNITIRDLTITSCYTDGVILGFLHDGTNNITIDNVTSTNNFRHGLTISSGTNISVTNCKFTDNGGYHPAYPGSYGTGIDMEDESSTASSTENVSISNCKFFGNVTGDVALQCFYGNDKKKIYIKDCDCNSSYTYNILVYSSSSSTIEDIFITQNYCNQSIACLAGVTNGDVRNINIIGNHCGSSIICGTHDLTIENLTISENSTPSIVMEDGFSYGNHVIKGNVVKFTETPSDWYDRALRYEFEEKAVVSGNYPYGSVSITENFFSGGMIGVSIGSTTSGVLFTNNIIEHVSTTEALTGGWGLYVAGGGHTITGNTIKDIDAIGLYSLADDSIISHNHITRCGTASVAGCTGLRVSGDRVIISENILLDNDQNLSVGDFTLDLGTSNLLVHNNITTSGFWRE